MKLIEKKCPNCGASLSFNENDKSCACQYCKRTFEIERDTDNLDKFILVYDAMRKPFKMFFLIPAIFIFVVAIIIFAVIFGSFKKTKPDNLSIYEKFHDEFVDKENLLTDASEISNTDMDLIYSFAKAEMSQVAEGVVDGNHSFSIDGDINREKLYVLYTEKHNYVILILKATYKDFFHQEDRKIVYLPVIYENIEKNVVSSLGNAKAEAPQYFLTDDQSTFVYGYASYDEAYENSVARYAEGFKVTER